MVNQIYNQAIDAKKFPNNRFYIIYIKKDIYRLLLNNKKKKDWFLLNLNILHIWITYLKIKFKILTYNLFFKKIK